MGSEKTILLYCKSGPATAAITARLVDGNRVVWSQEIEGSRPLLHSTQEFIVGLGAPAGLEDAVATIRRQAETKLAVSLVASASPITRPLVRLRRRRSALHHNQREDLLDSLTAEQQQAIVDWVLLGGRLILFPVGMARHSPGPHSPSPKLIPGEFVEIEPLRDRSGLEGFTKSELPFDDPNFQRNRPYVTRLKNTRGEVLLDEVSSASGRPLVDSCASGPRANYVRRLRPRSSGSRKLERPIRGWLRHCCKPAAATANQPVARRHPASSNSAMKTSSASLRVALDQFGGVSLVNFTTVSVLTLIYLLHHRPRRLLLLLSRLNLPRQITWLTFPARRRRHDCPHRGPWQPFSRPPTAAEPGGNNRHRSGSIKSFAAQRGSIYIVQPRDDSSVAWMLQLIAEVEAVRTGHGLLGRGLPGDAPRRPRIAQPALAPHHEYLLSTSSSAAQQIESLTLETSSSKSLIGLLVGQNWIAR